MKQQERANAAPPEGSVQDELVRIRHSLAHVLAQAVCALRPGTTLGFGPPIDDGFYYDFVLPEPLSEDDFPALEKKMKHILAQGQAFSHEDLEASAAFARLEAMGEPYKREYAAELCRKSELQALRFYRNGPFVDMCEGPHVANTRNIPAGCFKLRRIAGAYWRGDSNNTMMTRIYAWAFASKEALQDHVKAYEDAQARDHKKLGKELDIFHLDDTIGRGLPLWLPNGTVLRDELEKLIKELEFKAGYQRVATPHLAKIELYYRTGHLPYYAPHMYPPMQLKEAVQGSEDEQEVKETYALRPMNCPHHHLVFNARKRSYRELPLRLAEYGQVYRFEDSGALSGLLRVRGMCMNDAHIYCSEEQIKSEFLAVMQLHREVYDILGLTDYHFRFSTWDPDDPKGRDKYVDDPQAWERTQKLVHEAMVESGLPFSEGAGEAAFYGPKIDVQFRTVTGRSETVGTNQLDFVVPKRLNLRYVGADNELHHPYVIHRAPLSTHERLIAFLIEHFAGAFPTWLAPIQVRVVPVANRFNDYGQKLVDRLRSTLVRAELDASAETLQKKIRLAVTAKIPNIAVVGEREETDNTLTLRRYGRREQQTMSVDAFAQWLQTCIRERRSSQES